MNSGKPPRPQAKNSNLVLTETKDQTNRDSKLIRSIKLSNTETKFESMKTFMSSTVNLPQNTSSQPHQRT